MPEIEIKNETPLTYAEVAAKLKIVNKNRGEEEKGFRAKKAEEFLETFGKEDLKKVEAQKEKIKALNIQRLKDIQIVNLINIAPTDEDSVKFILANDNITLKQEDVKKLVDCLKQTTCNKEKVNRTVKEEKAIILDFLPNGYPMDTRPAHMKTAIAQAIGAEHFVLLEIVPKKGIFLKAEQEVYMGEGKREEVHHITGRINHLKLTQTAKMNLETTLKKLVLASEKRFIQFFNNAGPINARRHQLELIPGIGKKHMWGILEQRKEKPFENFKDLKERVKLMPDPENAIAKRIIMEMNEEDKHKLFVGA